MLIILSIRTELSDSFWTATDPSQCCCPRATAASSYSLYWCPHPRPPFLQSNLCKVLNFKFGLIARLGANFAVNEPQKVWPAVNCTGCTWSPLLRVRRGVQRTWATTEDERGDEKNIEEVFAAVGILLLEFSLATKILFRLNFNGAWKAPTQGRTARESARGGKWAAWQQSATRIGSWKRKPKQFEMPNQKMINYKIGLSLSSARSLVGWNIWPRPCPNKMPVAN